MWADTETNIDYINFSTVADSVVELIEQAQGKPLSIGVSGAWGVGKSSLVMLTKPGSTDELSGLSVALNENALAGLENLSSSGKDSHQQQGHLWDETLSHSSSHVGSVR